MNRKVLQINVTANWGSTGKIAEQVNNLAIQEGWQTYIAYGRYSHPSKSELIRVGSGIQVYEHYAEHRILDNDGLASRSATRELIKTIEEIQPDIIHLHNIHDHWLNYRILFEYFNTLDTPIVWTQHDCWSFTGDCGYYSALGCEEWIGGCSGKCVYRRINFPKRLFNKAKEHYNLKKKLFTATKSLTLVPVSKWLEAELRKSFFKGRPILRIYNGVDTNIFHPLEDIKDVLRKYGLEDKRYVVGVATIWSERKGFADYCRLAQILAEKVSVVLVGLNEQQREEAKHYGIIGIERTDNVNELVAIYSGASIVMNLSCEETFGLTTVEGFACGTPSIVYNTTASPVLVTPETGVVAEFGDIAGLANAVAQLLSKEKPINACRKHAIDNFNKEDRYQEYLALYKRLLGNKMLIR